MQEENPHLGRQFAFFKTTCGFSGLYLQEVETAPYINFLHLSKQKCDTAHSWEVYKTSELIYKKQ